MSATKLVVWKHEERVTQLRLKEDRLTIGRTEDNSLCLPDREVSKHHAEIKKGFLGYVVTDLGSVNGTIVNGHKITKKARLHAGDHINVGPFSLHFDPRGREAYEGFSKRAPRSVALQGIRGPDKGTLFSDNQAEIRIGTDTKSHLQLKRQKGAVKHHATIHFEGNRFYLIDHSGGKETYVNKVPVKRQVLAEGDFIRFAESVFTYHEVKA